MTKANSSFLSKKKKEKKKYTKPKFYSKTYLLAQLKKLLTGKDSKNYIRKRSKGIYKP